MSIQHKIPLSEEKPSWSASLRIILPVALTIALFAFSIYFIFIPSLERQMMAQKRSMLRNLTDSVWSLLEEYDQAIKENDVSLENIQKLAIQRIRQIRYGHERKDYFWVNDLKPRMIMHPYRTDLEGKDLSGYTDPNGERLFVKFVKTVKENGSGYVDYIWQWKDNPDNIVPKLSYVRLFEPWGWVIGTGIYLEDVRAEIGSIKQRLGLIFFGILAIVAALMLYVLSQTIKFERGRRAAQENLARNEQKYMKLYEESRKEQEVYRSLLRSSADAIVLYDLQGNARFVSPTFTKVFGWTLDEVKGNRIPFLPETEAEATLAIIKRLVEDGTPCQGFETKRFKKNGEILDVSISASRYDDHEGHPSGMLVVLRDISEKKRLEAQIQQAQKMESIGTLAGGIAHNFNNLLMAIQGNASLMRMDKRPDNPDYKRLENIEKYVRDGSTLAQELLGFARGGKYEIKPADLNDLVQKSAKMFGSARKEISIEIDCEKDIWTSEVDHAQIEQVLLNIYVNGWQAMAEGGRLSIKTANTRLDQAAAKAHRVGPGPYVKISIADTGTGMDAATVARIFDPFFTTKEVGQGTGLGLASAYGIIQNHKGFIDVRSTMGKGSTFSIYLPATPSKMAVELKTAQPEGETIEGSGTILLVDDEETVVEVGRDMIRHLGYTPLVARNGQEALEIYDAQREDIELIILDMIMPGMSGSATYEKLKSIDPDITVLLSSGYSLDGQATEILNQGCNGFIKKPFNLNELSKKIQDILKHSPGQEPPS